jgi:hypothetical protein
MQTGFSRLSLYGAPESITRNEFRQPMCLAGRYDNPLTLLFLAPTDSLKIPALEKPLMRTELWKHGN